MTEKRFTIEPTITRECIVDNTTGEQLDTFDYTERLCEVLNALHEENQAFEKVYLDLKHKHSLLHDECLELEIERDDLKQAKKELKEENEQLKQQLRTRHIVQKQYEENKKLKQENQRLKCINKQLEERLGRSLALDMEECR